MRIDINTYDEDAAFEIAKLAGVEPSVDTSVSDEPVMYSLFDLNNGQLSRAMGKLREYAGALEIKDLENGRKVIWPTSSGMSLDQVLDVI